MAKRATPPNRAPNKCIVSDLTPKPAAPPTPPWDEGPKHPEAKAPTVPPPPEAAPPPSEAAPAEDPERLAIRQELLSSQSWQVLKDEFSERELLYFEEGYVKLMQQFRSDVLPSEETQIFQAIKYEILMSRNLQARNRAIQDINRLEAMQGDFLSRFGGDHRNIDADDREVILSFETQIQTARSAEQTRTTEYVKLQERHSELLKSLKSTRDQRIKQIENSKLSFMDMLKSLQDKEVQKREGRSLMLGRLAGQQAYKDLGAEFTYDDGSVDRPILSADTVGLRPGEDVGEAD